MSKSKVKTEKQRPEVNHKGSGKREAARIQKQIEQEREARATECLERIQAITKELNCTIDIQTVLSSEPNAQSITHRIQVRALDWPAEG